MAHDLARVAARLAAVADEWDAAPAAARPALRVQLYRCQTVLALGARRLAQAGRTAPAPPAGPFGARAGARPPLDCGA